MCLSRPCDRLTPRERRACRLMAIGYSNRIIAETLGTTIHVIKNLNQLVFDKIGMDSRVEVALWYWNRYPEELLLSEAVAVIASAM